MRAWLVRAGKDGQREAEALADGLAILGWEEVDDLTGVETRDDVFDALRAAYDDAPETRLRNWTNQIWAFVNRIEKGDHVVMPLKRLPQIAIPEDPGPASAIVVCVGGGT